MVLINKSFIWSHTTSGVDAGTVPLRTTFHTRASGGGSTSTLNSGIYYIYDGKRVIQERDTNNSPTVSYTRGNDLSGTLAGAGGIGGLLARTDGSGNTFYHADGNGNITYLETSAQGLGAKYRYDPFGNLTSSSGTYATANTYRFSSKEWVPSVNGYYYLYRFYMPGIERWLNRDPIGERGGKNLYRNVGNNLISVVDLFGLIPWQDVSWWPPQTQPPNTGGPIFNDGNNWNPGSDNCLAYGLDVHGCIQPDGTPDGEGNAKDCPGLKKQLTSGKFSQNYPVPDSGAMCGKCKNGEHKIKVFSDGNGGYHIQRQDADGSWSEMSLNPTYPPRPAQPDSGKPCGELCVPNQ